MTKTLFSFAAFLVLGLSGVHAQQGGYIHQCLTDYYLQQAVARDPAIRVEEDRFNQIAATAAMGQGKANATVRIVPVVFHVLHMFGKENITHEQIEDQVRILNEDYRKLAGTPGGGNPQAVDCLLEFRLANKDPNGNCFSGVNRIYSTLTGSADDAIKAAVPSNWRTGKYFNIFVVAAIKDTDGDPGTTTLGYAQFPWQGGTSTRGVVVRADYVGTIGTSSKAKAGRVLTHEVGHCFGLYHTFQGGCWGGDQVGDTPPVADQNFGACSPSKNSCTNDNPDLPDMLENYMDYTDGDCQNIFTAGQKNRMDQNINTYYATLISASNLTATGVSGYTPPASTKLPPVQEGFEGSGTAMPTGWDLQNLGGDMLGWRITDTSFHNGARSIYMPSFYHPTTLTRNTYNFISPTYNLAFSNNIYLNFYKAYAQRTTSFSDTLNVYVTTNCGITWTNVFKQGGPVLATAAATSATFRPTANQWKSVSINLAPFRASNVRFRFEFMYARGNNLYLDDIELSNQPVGLVYQEPLLSGVHIYPNPARQDASVSFTLAENSHVQAGLYNLMGQQIGLANLGNKGEGENSFNISEISNGILAEGIYLLKLEAGNSSQVSKLVISR